MCGGLLRSGIVIENTYFGCVKSKYEKTIRLDSWKLGTETDDDDEFCGLQQQHRQQQKYSTYHPLSIFQCIGLMLMYVCAGMRGTVVC